MTARHRGRIPAWKSRSPAGISPAGALRPSPPSLCSWSPSGWPRPLSDRPSGCPSESPEEWGPEAGGLACSVSVGEASIDRIGITHLTVTTFVRNVGTESVEMAGDDPLLVFNVRIEDPDGRSVPMTHFGRRRFEDALGSGGTIVYALAPGQQRRTTIHLDGMYDLSRPGRYRLTVSRSPLLLGPAAPS